MFGFFKRRTNLFKLTPEQDEFLASAIEYHNRNLELLNKEWGFDDYQEWGFEQATGEFFLIINDGSRVIADGQIYGSFDKSTRTWEWAWNNPNVLECVAADSKEIKKYGKKEGIGYLVDGLIPTLNATMATYLGSIGEKINNAQGLYMGSSGKILIFIGLKNLSRSSSRS